MACLERAGEAESHLGPQLGPEQAARQKSASRGLSRVSRGTRGAAFLSIKTSNDSSSRRTSTPQGPQRTPTLRPSPRCTPRLLSLHLYWVQNIPEFLPLAFARDVPISFHQGPGQITYPGNFLHSPTVPLSLVRRNLPPIKVGTRATPPSAGTARGFLAYGHGASCLLTQVLK